MNRRHSFFPLVRDGLNSGWNTDNKNDGRYQRMLALRQDRLRLEEMKTDGADPWDIWYLQESIRGR